MIHENRRRAQSFGADARRYDRARPSYPPAMVDELVADRPRRVLDVGCGTGLVARLFLARECDVLGVEPDPRMAAVAESHGIQVEVESFEAWDPGRRIFDLVVSGQAWHWIDPSVGPRKAAAILRPLRALAIFWNCYRHDAETKVAFDEAYAQFAPALAKDSVPLGNMPLDNAGDISAITATGLFGPCQLRTYSWAQRYSGNQWLDQLATHSDHALLPAHQLSDLFNAVDRAIERLGGSITVQYETCLITARRNDDEV